MSIDFIFKDKCVLKWKNRFISLNHKLELYLSKELNKRSIWNVYSTSNINSEAQKLVLIKHSIFDWWLNNKEPLIISWCHFSDSLLNQESINPTFEYRNKYETKLIYNLTDYYNLILIRNKRDLVLTSAPDFEKSGVTYHSL